MKRMRIEILEADRMTFVGSGVLKALQNNSMPHVDLLVREAIQNSLDASCTDVKSVDVSVDVGKFSNKKLFDLLEGLEPNILTRHGQDCTFISVSDKNTEGLTGPLYKENFNDEDGNLNKLIYHLSRPQEREGSGGSWGYGKTIFYRVGIGMVIYYSRIKLKDTYQERLAVAHIEDEKSSSNYIKYPPGMTKSGIAWWGELYDSTRTIPTIDSELISEILSVFNIPRYKGDETGTTVIVPYIDESDLLNHNRPEHPNKNWYLNLSDYIDVAIQRWYAPRLNNPLYLNGSRPYLVASVNGSKVVKSDETIFFEYLTQMYNYAIGPNKNRIPLFNEKGIAIHYEPIILTNPQMDSKTVGTLVFAKFNYKDLGLKDFYSPWKPSFLANQIDFEATDLDQNKPLIAFTRKPGMIVNYETSGEWLNKVPSTGVGEFIFGIFVLNSDNKIHLEDSKYSLEEYIRGGEQADHTSWADHQLKKYNFNIVKRIQSNSRTKLINAFKEVEEEIQDITVATRFGKYLGDRIMPKTGFGKRSTRTPGRSVVPKDIVTTTSFGTVKIFEKEKKYIDNGLVVPYRFTVTKDGHLVFYVTIEIKQDGGSMAISKYETDMKLASPISLEIVNIKEKRGFVSSEEYECKHYASELNTIHSYRMFISGKKGMTVAGEIVIKTSNLLFNPVIKASLKEKNNG